MASWQTFIEQQEQQEYYHQLQQRIAAERAGAVPVYPPEHQVFRAFQLTPLEQVRVVIVGQDPYHQPNQAHGLAFSVAQGVKVPPSLKNIYKAIQHDFPNSAIPSHGNLEGWAKQGVLLLNTSLTVRDSMAGSHANLGWQQFTHAAIQYLAAHHACAYLLWGKHAQEMAKPLVENSRTADQSLMLTSVHPSPLSAHRGFLTCGHFAATNTWLTARGQAPIAWLPEATKEAKQFTFL